MYFNGLRILVGGVGVDAPIGAFANGQVMLYDQPNNVLRGGPAFAAGFAADDVGVWDGTAFVPKQRSVRRLSGVSQSNNTTTYADIPGLTVPINRIGHVVFEYVLFYSTSVTTEGIGLQLAFTGTALQVNYGLDMFTDAATRAALLTATAFGSGLAARTSGPGPSSVLAYIKGSCEVTTVGNLSVQFRAEAGGGLSVTALVGSWAHVFAV